ncbi:MAG: hypothetical protein ACI8SK_001371 [Shewanella sp.]|jgi:hypothetical protein
MINNIYDYFIIVSLGFLLASCGGDDTGLLDRPIEPPVKIEPSLHASPEALTLTMGDEKAFNLSTLVKAVGISSWELTQIQDSSGLGVIKNKTATGFDYLAQIPGVTSLPYEIQGGGRTAFSEILIAINTNKTIPDGGVTNTKPTAESATLTTTSEKNVNIDLRNYINDINNDALSIIKVIAPSGRFTLGADSFILTFSPQGFVGIDHAVYVVSDGHDGYAIADVVVISDELTPVTSNAKPIAKSYNKNINSQTMPVWDISLINLGLISDADNDSLKIVRIFDGNGRAVIDGDTDIIYTPGTFTGVDQFSYVISDGKQAFAVGTLTLTVSHPTATNQTPKAKPIIVHNVMDNDTKVSVISVANSVSDSDGDPLHLVSVLGANGQVTIDASHPLDVGYLPNGAIKQDKFIYAVTNGKGGYAQSTITVELISQNTNPPIAKIVNATTLDNQILAINLNDYISDAETNNAGLTISHLSPATAPAVVTLLPEKQLQYVPNGFVGADILTYTLSDGELSTTGTVVIIVNHDDDNSLKAQNFSVTVQPSSANNILDWLPKVSSDITDSIYTLLNVSAPTLGTVTTSGGVLKYSPLPGKFGEDRFVYTVKDSQNYPHYAQGTISITILPPVMPIITALTVDGSPTLGSVLTGKISCGSCSAAKYQYKWVINGLTAGTASTYTFTTADIGQNIRLEVMGTDIYGQSVSEYVVNQISFVESIFSNKNAFAALKDNGSVVTWGIASYGGDSNTVADKLSSGVKSIFPSDYAFAALKDDGSMVTWGEQSWGGDSSAVTANLSSGVSTVYAAPFAFAALKDNGSVVTWGLASSGGDSSAVTGLLNSGVKSISSTSGAFAALKDDGSVVTWGHSSIGGQSVAGLNSGVVKLFSTAGAFAALKGDGSVVTWGDPDYGGDSSENSIGSTAVTSPLISVSNIFSGITVFAALNDDSSLLTWGSSSNGGDSSAVADELTSGIDTVFLNSSAMAALKINGSVVTWGNSIWGGDSSAVADSLLSGVTSVFSTSTAFAALKDDGSVVTWGLYGGDSSAVSTELTSGTKTVVSNQSAFVALKDDGSVVTWGAALGGGDSSAVAQSLSSDIRMVLASSQAFVAIKLDGSVVTWGADFTADTGFEKDKLDPNIILIESSLLKNRP